MDIFDNLKTMRPQELYSGTTFSYPQVAGSNSAGRIRFVGWTMLSIFPSQLKSNLIVIKNTKQKSQEVPSGPLTAMG